MARSQSGERAGQRMKCYECLVCNHRRVAFHTLEELRKHRESRHTEAEWTAARERLRK